MTRHIHIAIPLRVAGLLSAVCLAAAGPPAYQLGDLAGEDVVTPVALQVVNPDASAVLKQKAAAQVPLIYRQVLPSTEEAARDLRTNLDTVRSLFMAALQQALHGRVPDAGDVDSPAYLYTLSVVTREAPNHPPLARLAPLWVRGSSDIALVDTLLQPLGDVMAKPIVDDQGLEPLPVDQPVLLMQVKDMLDTPSLADLEAAGLSATAADLSNLAWARKVVETYFPSGQEEIARYAASFVRPNTFPAPGLTELLRARRRDLVAVIDTYEAGQLIVRKGQIIDRKALTALAAARENKLIESLLTRVEPEPSTDRRNTPPLIWLIAGIGAAGLILLLLLWRWKARPDNAEKPDSIYPVLQPPALRDDGSAEGWRTRALIAESKVERAHTAIRTGALGWMREKIFRSLFQQRAELVGIQQTAEEEMRELERRMEQLLVPLQGRILAYEKRIQELEQALSAQGEKDRQLIDARVNVLKQQLDVERARLV